MKYRSPVSNIDLQFNYFYKNHLKPSSQPEWMHDEDYDILCERNRFMNQRRDFRHIISTELATHLAFGMQEFLSIKSQKLLVEQIKLSKETGKPELAYALYEIACQPEYGGRRPDIELCEKMQEIEDHFYDWKDEVMGLRGVRADYNMFQQYLRFARETELPWGTRLQPRESKGE